MQRDRSPKRSTEDPAACVAVANEVEIALIKRSIDAALKS